MKDFIKKTEKELKNLLLEKRQALRAFRFSIAGSNTRNVKEGNALKKDIARILGLVNSKAKAVK
ncbi:50S ribosomal protein L29 [Patescibacteria group bacterium]|nr:50S ribosomal protein L29 [Patescibacteria group bacterium]